MIDSLARSIVRQAVDDYFSDRITAFHFSERLFEIATDDRTVRFVIGQLWYIYDDCQDHLVHADKATWDCVQRLLLLLESGGEIELQTRRHWHGSQPVAAIALLAMRGTCWFTWLIWPLPLFLGGMLAMALSQWRNLAHKPLEWSDPWRRWPFPSLSMLQYARESAPYFQKRRHRREVAARQLRSPSEERMLRFQY